MNNEESLCAPALRHDEVIAAITALIERMDAIDAQCNEGFPLYSLKTEDHWTVSKGGSWTGGFWAANWWLRARITGAASDLNKAALICRRLAAKLHAASINRAMLFWYGAAPGAIGFDNPEATRLVHEAAAALAASHEPVLQCLPLGTDMGGGPDGDRRLGVDTLAPLIQLLCFGDHDEYRDIARQHTDTLIAACLTIEGACCSGARYEHGIFRPVDQAGDWSRGQAWAMLGLSAAAVQWGGAYIGHAQSACEYWLRSRPQALPPDRLVVCPGEIAGLCRVDRRRVQGANRSDSGVLSRGFATQQSPSSDRQNPQFHLDRPLDQADALRDPSASLIAALAMLSLAPLVADGERWAGEARCRIAALLRSKYFVRQQNGAAIFWGACYQIEPGRHELIESAWGSFFLLEALCLLAK